MFRRALPLLGLAAVVAAGWWLYRAQLPPSPEERLRQGQEALLRGDTAAAESCADALQVGGHPDHALLLRGQALVQQGQYPDALAVLNRIQDQGDLRLEAVSLVGRCHLALGELAQAERALSYLLSQRPDAIDGHRGLAAVYHDQGDFLRAVHHYRQWARLNGRDGRPHRAMGLIYKDLSKDDEAVPCYREALRRELKEVVRQEVRLELAECLYRQKEYAQALQALEEARPSAGLAGKAMAQRAECLHALGRGPEALGVVQQALALEPVPPGALRLRAQLHLEAGEPRAAAELLERALRADPHDYASRHHLALAYARLGRAADADEQRRRLKQTQGYLEELTRLTRDVMGRPTDPGLHARMAELYERLNMPEAAARCRRNAERLRPAAGAAGPKR